MQSFSAAVELGFLQLCYVYMVCSPRFLAFLLEVDSGFRSKQMTRFHLLVIITTFISTAKKTFRNWRPVYQIVYPVIFGHWILDSHTIRYPMIRSLQIRYTWSVTDLLFTVSLTGTLYISIPLWAPDLCISIYIYVMRWLSEAHCYPGFRRHSAQMADLGRWHLKELGLANKPLLMHYGEEKTDASSWSGCFATRAREELPTVVCADRAGSLVVVKQ